MTLEDQARIASVLKEQAMAAEVQRKKLADELIAEVYQRKTAISLEHIRKDGVTIRPGVLEMLRKRRRRG